VLERVKDQTLEEENSTKVLLICMHLSNPHTNQKSFPA